MRLTDVLSVTDLANAFSLVLFVMFFLVLAKDRSSLELFACKKKLTLRSV